MERQTQQRVAMGLSLVGILFFMAVAFDILANNVGMFLGVSFMMVSGVVWAVGGK